ncbi:3-oxo-5,6-didehydrosuberyl-CoA/3-oxoadipyl-CoA thiolase [Parasphingorhabdus marina DSM 22363]|uniref:Beta-ketoadipyl-CoA thiolase n=1 Tax=Parasphingorhabdus marina DSM 22363 TaxID=1123272 RepID=A0A1N6D9W6_9SPHN|nr:3-oxoadipyl-CoA thiolase [Parasphingorhabdus marina]SIN67578.1 3-oxo-5,6-didehydrosuberyl-CoA/3-oxoadipyl-CoA thiolase [Parasphingorhabdus marina DSM 22363]
MARKQTILTQRHAFLCENIRTPIGRYGGGLAAVRPDDLAAAAIKSVIESCSGLDTSQIDDVILGCANQAGEDNRNVARMSALLAGLPENVPGVTVNRLCASGLVAVGTAAQAIVSGDADLIVAGGVESMSRAPFVMGKSDAAWSRNAEVFDTTIGWRFINRRMDEKFGTDSMPETAENVAEDYGVSREDQDSFALRSQQRAGNAQKSGIFSEEITPLEIAGRKNSMSVMEHDEHIRVDTTLEKLSSLKAPFRKGGSVTAGNASGVNDGAAAMLIVSDEAVKRHGLNPIARISGMVSAGVAPRVMGVGPVPAVRKLLAKQSRTISDFDVVELNEAFAAQALAVLRELGLEDDAEHVNPNGGAIALGHPLGMSGARLALTAARELKRRGGNRALATMCVGVGQGTALSLEAV